MDVNDQMKLFLEYLKVMVQAVAMAGPDGAPEGRLYAIMMSKVSLESFNQLVRVGVEGKCFTKRGNLLIASPDLQASVLQEQP